MEPYYDLPSNRTTIILRTKGKKSRPIAGWVLLPHRTETSDNNSPLLRSSTGRFVHQGSAGVPEDLQEEIHAFGTAGSLQQDGEERDRAERYPDEAL